MDPGARPAPTVRVPFVLDLPEGRIEAEMELPAGPMTLSEFADATVGLSNEVAAMGERITTGMGKKISCCKGCGACCRQMVPISPAEAYMLADMVESMPEPWRGRMKDRFAEVESQLRANGLLDRINHLHDIDRTDAENRETSKAYFALQIPCPFLQNESCGIYAYRPAICREYLVISPAELCKNPYKNRVTRVPVSVKITEALARVSAGLMGGQARALPLSLALAWVRNHPEGAKLAADGREMLEVLVKYIHEGAAREVAEAEAREKAAPAPPEGR